LAFSNAALHWVKDRRPVVRGVASSLRSGGRLLLQMGGEGNTGEIVAVMDLLISEARWRAYFVGFDFPYGFWV